MGIISVNGINQDSVISIISLIVDLYLPAVISQTIKCPGDMKIWHAYISSVWFKERLI